ncbi:hypothetical protein L484_018844 [Morus notabilis]|uniref:Uncharacterized protein n=1 Tax=Morus notabilis TaxID=981085 RepID=W9RPH0_9ROSA|nr:hypothetical protein L484_018844 [Morus notabilis]
MGSSDTTDPPNIRRRNSIATSVVVVPTTLSLSIAKPRHSASFPIENGAVAVPPPPPLNFELIALKTTSSSYTSLKDLLPSSPSAGGGGINSPTSASASAASEISIRNRLVKQAAWAYLQPMSSSPSSTGPRFLRRLWLRFSSQNVVASCLAFINSHVIPSLSRAVDHLLRALRVRTPVR